MDDRLFKILLIDDDEDEFLIFSDLLDDAGIQVETEWASSYEDGIKVMLKEEHDVYFVDYHLGARTGLDLFKEAQNYSFHKPVILLTGQGNRKLDMMALQHGMADYLSKSGLTSELLDRSLRYAINRFELLLQANEEKWRYNSLFQYSMDPIVVCDLNFRIKESNRAFKELIGPNKSILQTVLFEEFVSDIFKKLESNPDFQKNGVIKDHHIEIQGDDKVMDFLISIVTMKDKEDNSEAYQIIFHDMTQVREAEKEKRIIEQMKFTEKLAQLIAHEVRNPLTNINLAVEQYAELETPSVDDKSLYFNMIRRNSDRINKLISQILDSSQPTKIQRSKALLKDVVNDSLTLCMDRINLNDVELNLNLAEQFSPIQIDKEKMTLALTNILTNAIEAMVENDKGKLDVATSFKQKIAQIQIKDNGKGMDEMQASKVFEPFYSGRQGGKGLGMTLTKNVILSHQGKISIETKLGEGTIFLIELPL